VPREAVDLRELKIAVTFCGPLEPIRPSALDFSTYGIVVRGQAHTSRPSASSAAPAYR
jgi:hypothetical protein